MTDTTWLDIVANRLDSMDISIVVCLVGIIFFMKYDRRTTNTTGHKYIALCLGIGFLMLISFRIYKGL